MLALRWNPRERYVPDVCQCMRVGHGSTQSDLDIEFASLSTRREELKDQARVGSRIQNVSCHLCDSQRKFSQLARQRYGERLRIRRVALVHDAHPAGGGLP
jgi:hypothetical protein